MNQEETMLLHKERYKETINNLTVMSDILAWNVFKDKNACEYVLRIILEDKELTVIDNETQMDFRNMHGRGVVLDCVAFLSLNTFHARISLITVRFLIVSLYLSLCKSIVSS